MLCRQGGMRKESAVSHPHPPSSLPTGYLPDEHEDESSAVRLADVSADGLVDFDAEEDESTAVRVSDLNADDLIDFDAEDDDADAGASDAAPIDAFAGAASSGGSSGGTSGGTAIGIEELAIEKWTEEQKKVYESVKKKAQEMGLSQNNVERIAAYSVLQFIHEKNENPDTRVDRVQAVNANGDVIVRMEHMKYGDREPIFNNDVRLKDAPAFEQSAAQIEQANERIHNKSASEQEIAQRRQNDDLNQNERPSLIQRADDQVMARLQSSAPALRL